MAKLGNASQRARRFWRVASFVVIASTVLFTLFTVRHLAGAIAVRHSLANSSEFEVQGRKLLPHTADVVDKSHPHWLSDGSVRKPVDSIRGKSLHVVLCMTHLTFSSATQTPRCWLQYHCQRLQQGTARSQGEMPAPYSSRESV